MLNNFPNNFRRDDEEEVLNEFRQKQINFDLEERKNEVNNSRSLFIGALAGLAMAGIVGWFVLAPQYQGSGTDNIPIITRPQTVVKIQPSEPGDIELASQERTVYDIIEKKTPENEDENIVQSVEEPNAKGIEQLVEEAAVETVKTEAIESLTQKAATPEEETAQIEQPKKEAVQEKVVAGVSAVDVDKVVPTEIKKGSWQVQLMSSPNKAAVEKSWAKKKQKYPMLGDLPYEIEAANLGAKGTFYRLKAGSFASKDAATDFCNKLKTSGGSCFVAKK